MRLHISKFPGRFRNRARYPMHCNLRRRFLPRASLNDLKGKEERNSGYAHEAVDEKLVGYPLTFLTEVGSAHDANGQVRDDRAQKKEQADKTCILINTARTDVSLGDLTNPISVVETPIITTEAERI
jgi:hypothetical protein